MVSIAKPFLHGLVCLANAWLKSTSFFRKIRKREINTLAGVNTGSALPSRMYCKVYLKLGAGVLSQISFVDLLYPAHFIQHLAVPAHGCSALSGAPYMIDHERLSPTTTDSDDVAARRKHLLLDQCSICTGLSCPESGSLLTWI